MSGKRFPIIGEPGVTVAWEVVEPLRDAAKQVHGQTLERLAERGGLSRLELGGLLVGLNVFEDRPRTPLFGCTRSLPVEALAPPQQKGEVRGE